MKEIAAALVKAQKNFAPALKKAENPYFGSKYADLAVCIEAVIDSLHDNGIALIQHTDESEKGVIVSTVFLHESGEIYEAGSIYVPAAQNSPQAFGSALTYARRYSLMAACGIAPEDDDGNAASKAQAPKILKPEQTAEQYDYWTTKHGDVPSWNSAAEAENAGTPSHGSSDETQRPTCKHGERIWKEGTKKDGSAWGGYMCPEPKGDTQCQPSWYIFGSNGMWRAQ